MISFTVVPDIKHREYSKIFTGTTGDGGYENIFLSFASNTKEIIFQPGQNTTFHYSHFAPEIFVTNSSLITDGATSGKSPLKADKIFKKQDDYALYTGATISDSDKTGVWACSWLSGGPTDTSVWVDRFYNPGQITLQGALSAQGEIYVRNIPVVYDVTSTLKLDPGALYMYHHIGDAENQIILNNFNSTLVLNLSSWGESSKVNDVKMSALDFTTTTPFKVDSLIPSDSELTVATWAKTNNWTNIRGNQIFGNYFRGGWGLTFEPGLVGPIMAIFENHNGHLLIGNKEGRFIVDKDLIPSSKRNANLSFIAIDKNSHIFLIDNEEGNFKTIYKLDTNGDILDVGPLNGILPTKTAIITDLKLDGFGNPHVMVQYAGYSKVYRFDSGDLSTPKMAYTRSALHNKMALVKLNTLGQDCRIVTKKCSVSPLAGDLITDLDDIVWQVREIAPNVFEVLKHKSKENGGIQFIQDLNITTYHSIKVDPYNNLWILCGTNEFIKINARTCRVVKRGTIGLNERLSNDPTREIGFSKEFKNDTFVDVAWVFDGQAQKLFKTDFNGNILEIIGLTNKLNYSKYDSQILGNQIKFQLKGDFLGTDWLIKYQYSLAPSLGFNIKIKNPAGDIADVRLNYDIEKLVGNRWYLFTMTFNANTGVFSIYKNSMLEKTTSIYINKFGDETDLIGCKIYQLFKNSIVFGGNAGKFSSLREELQINGLEFNGSLAEPRIYNQVLDLADIKYLTKRSYKAKPLIWNIPVGKQVLIEEIERFFKHKFPGAKSKFYNINLKNLGITDSGLKLSIEAIIRKAVKSAAPAHCEINKIKWH